MKINGNLHKSKNVDLNSKLYTLLTNPEHFNKNTLDEKIKFLENFEYKE